MSKFKKTHEEYLLMAYKEATKSPDPSTQNGAVLIFHDLHGREQYYFGHTDYPEGVKNKPERLERPMKYSFVEHAERKLVFEAARMGVFGCYNARDMLMVVPWFACADCARAIVDVGIKHVVGHKRMMDKTPDHWKQSVEYGLAMMGEAGVKMELIDTILDGPEIRFNGELWRP